MFRKSNQENSKPLHTVNILNGDFKILFQYTDVTMDDLMDIVQFTRMSNKSPHHGKLHIEIYCKESPLNHYK